MAIQHSIILLAFLIQFSSLYFPSLGYDEQDIYFISCGSDSNVTVTESNKVYIGESNPNYPKTSFSKSSIETSQSSVPSPLYQTARIFHSESLYEFKTVPNNTYMVRFHFFSFSSPLNLSTAKFTVSVPGFILLQNFDAKNTTNSPLVKEYYLKIIRKKFKITFTPQKASFAFANAIELFMLPVHLIPDSIALFHYKESTGRNLSTYSNDFLSRSLETNLRLNVGGGIVNRETDTLSREWLPDDRYITDPQNAKNGSFEGDIKRTANDESVDSNSNKYIGPDIVYKTAKVSVNVINRLVLQLSFSSFDSYVINVNDNQSLSLQMPYYYDFVVRSDSSGLLKVSVVPNTSVEVARPNAFLNGLELMKVIESSGPIPNDDSDSRKISLPVVVGSVIGGLLLVSMVVVLFLWISKIRKQRPVEKSEWLPIPAARGGSSHSRLTDATTIQGSPLPNINLGLKIPLLDLLKRLTNFYLKL
ncbi:LOW QUALITY PROTEIN: probable receptor-like protein kinase At2g23200 [Medicago truncatula]|uniref:LOW QUALITY PROTEIN: probable receptor-like protein kinase At2g23200 n=1 Tax=Medicago truncatula TaxID=3880 RepID=UPI0019685BB6|nr:LOW QUALITY PROTEIN: probable receptor-like protein kinase At2g23200 [Medicago truncatula]